MASGHVIETHSYSERVINGALFVLGINFNYN